MVIGFRLEDLRTGLDDLRVEHSDSSPDHGIPTVPKP